jgi:hypothetical protein
MDIKLFDYETDSAEVSKWGEKHSFPLPPKDILPATGFMVNEAACGFLYMTDSRIAWLEWIFSNPEKTKEERAEALDLLFQKLESHAKERGIAVIFTSCGSDGYSRVLGRNGFEETDKNVTQYIKIMRSE